MYGFVIYLYRYEELLIQDIPVRVQGTTEAWRHVCQPPSEIQLARPPVKSGVFMAQEVLRDLNCMKLDDQAAALTVIKARVWYDEDDQVLQMDHAFRLINEDTRGNPVTRGKPNSRWTIYTWGIP